MHLLQMLSASNMPIHDQLSKQSKNWSKKEVLEAVMKGLGLRCVLTFWHIIKIKNNGVKGYAIGILSQDLLYLELCDVIHEEDGTKILHHWHYLMLVFQYTQWGIKLISIFCCLKGSHSNWCHQGTLTFLAFQEKTSLVICFKVLNHSIDKEAVKILGSILQKRY